MIKDYQVDAAARELGHGSPHNRGDVRRALEAAANAKEPEVVVTEEMARMGASKLARYGYGCGVSTSTTGPSTYLNTELGKLSAKVYRAMRALEPSATDSARTEPNFVTAYMRHDGHCNGLFEDSRSGKERRKSQRQGGR